MMLECSGCQEEVEESEAYDPGCNYGCGFLATPAPACHERFCTESCFEHEQERREERRLSQG